MNDDTLDSLVADYFDAQEPASEPPTTARPSQGWILGSLVAAAAVLVIGGAGAGLWMTGGDGDPAREVEAVRVASVVPLPAMADLPEVVERNSVYLGARFEVPVEPYSGRPDLDADPLLVVFVEPWCPHCGPGVQDLLDARDDVDSDVPVLLLASLSRGSTEADLDAWMEPFEDEVDVALYRAADATHLTQGTVPHMLLVEGGEVSWVGHPALFAAAW